MILLTINCFRCFEGEKIKMKCEISFVTRSDEECTKDCVWWNKCPKRVSG